MDAGEAFDMVDVGLTPHDHLVGWNMLTAIGTGAGRGEHFEVICFAQDHARPRVAR